MNTFGFDEIVVREFTFLKDVGFKLETREPTIVQFISPLYRLNLFFGPRTHEIGLEFGLLKPAKYESSCSFSPLIAIFDKQAGENVPIFPPVTTAEGVLRQVRYYSSNFIRYVKLDCLKSPELWPKVRDRAREMFDARYKALPISHVKARFDLMWNNGDYNELLKAFWPVREHLSDDQRHKLAVAQRTTRARGAKI